MANITISNGLPTYNLLALLTAAFSSGELAGGGFTATLTVDNYLGSGQQLLVTFNGAGLDVDTVDDKFNHGNVDSITLQLDTNLVATINYGGSQAPVADINGVLDLFPGSPTDQQVLDAFGVVFFQEDTNIDGSSNAETIYGSNEFFTHIEGNGGDDTIIGGNHDADLQGGSGNDSITGGNRSDNLRGGIGNDTLIGGGADDDNSDFFVGGAGDDLIIGGTHNHEGNRVQYREETRTLAQGNPETPGTKGVIVNLSGNTFNVSGAIQTATGQTESSVDGHHALDSYGDTDELQYIQNVDGTRFSDYIIAADDGSDLAGYEGNDTFAGGNGWDGVDYFNETRQGNANDGTRGVIANLSGSALTITAAIASATGQTTGSVSGGTVIDTYGFTDTLSDIESLGGTKFNDYLVSAGNPSGPDSGNSLTGYKGNDTLVGSDQADNLDYERETRQRDNNNVAGTHGVAVNLSGAQIVVALTPFGITTGSAKTTLAAGSAIDSFGGRDTLHDATHAASFESVNGTDFNDYIVVKTDNAPNSDTSVDGHDGNDYIELGSQNSHASGGDGNDTLVGAAGTNGDSNFYDPGKDNDVITDAGRDANEYDNLEYYNDQTGITVDKTNRWDGTVHGTWAGTDTFTGIEIVVGGDQADTFNGSRDDDDFTGNGGNDTFNGGGGWDQVVYEKEQTGPNGGDIDGVIINLSDDELAVTVDIRNATGQSATTVEAHHAVDSFGAVDELNSIESIYTAYKNDYVQTGTGDAHVQTNDGDDTIIGGGGHVDFDGGQGNDSIVGGGGNGWMGGWTGNDTLVAGDGDVDIDTGGGNDSVVGGAGHSYISANGGTDIVDGGLGYDALSYNSSGDDSSVITVVVTGAGSGTVGGHYDDSNNSDNITNIL